jgi:hypothetical protein
MEEKVVIVAKKRMLVSIKYSRRERGLRVK